MSNNIVTLNVSQTQAPIPSNLQSTGAMLSQGATITTPGTKSLLTQAADLTPLLAGSHTLSGMTYSGFVVTATASAPHGLTIGQPLEITVSGATPSGYNGTWLATPTDATHFTFPVPGALASCTVPGVYTLEDVAELIAMVDTFFAQGVNQSVYVLELGAGSVDAGVAFLAAWITANPNVFYSYLVPRVWDAVASFLAFLALFNATTAKTYFFVTTTLATYASYTALLKCVVPLIEAYQTSAFAANVLTAAAYANGVVTAATTTAHGVAVGDWFQISGMTPAGYNGRHQALPGTAGSTLLYALPADPGAETILGTLVASYYASPAIPATEFTSAADFQHTLSYAPSNINKVTPNAFAFLFGVTPFPQAGNSALLATLKAANINIVGTGAEGGITNTMLLWGVTADGRDFTYWYAVDWLQINEDLNISNEVINGSNNPINPLYYDQNGINRLQARAQGVVNNGITFGLLLGPSTVDAVPFNTYVAANPGDFRIGKYAGLSVTVTPNRGFTAIVFNINVTDFPAA